MLAGIKALTFDTGGTILDSTLIWRHVRAAPVGDSSADIPAEDRRG